MTGAELIAAVEAAGGTVEITADHERVRCRLPRSGEALMEEVREQGQEILEVLRKRFANLPAHQDSSEAVLKPHLAEADLSDLAERVDLWLRSQCFAVHGCATSPRRLHDEFSRWARVERCPFVEHAFLERLLELGFVLDESAFIVGLVPKADFMIAREYAQERLEI